MRKKAKPKEPIRLRQRTLANGNISLFLDMYRDGKRSYEFLKLYLVPERTREDKEQNRQTMQLAQSIKAQRIVEMQNGECGFKSKFAEDTLFFEFYRAMCEARHGEESNGNWGNWYSALKHLQRYEHNERITFAEITPAWVQGFKDYLETAAYTNDGHYAKDGIVRKLSRNSKLSYFNKLRACLNEAFEKRIIAYNPMRGIDNFKAEEGKRMYLTIDELRKLAQTPCRSEEVKTAFLFSCLTGLRRSDIAKLTWGEVHHQSGFTRIIFRQKKTGGQEYLDITTQAAALMGERGADDERVFKWFNLPSSTNDIIRVWVANAGINKDITFHCGRHTFATMMLDLGTDLFTVSKLLGHADISTTQIYAKVLDKAKQAAVAAIPDVFGISEHVGNTEQSHETE